MVTNTDDNDYFVIKYHSTAFQLYCFNPCPETKEAN